MRPVLILISVLLLALPTAAQQDTCGPGVTYTVASGDTLFRIAQRYGTDVATLLQANNLANANLIFAGQVLNVPCSGQPVQPTATPSPPVTTNLLRNNYSGDLQTFTDDLAIVDDTTVAFTSVERPVRIYSLDAPDGEPVGVGSREAPPYTVTADGRGLLAYAEFDAALNTTTVRVRGLTDQAVTFALPAALSLNDIAITGDRLAVASGEFFNPQPTSPNTVEVWDLVEARRLAALDHDSPVAGVQFSTDGSRLAASTIQGIVTVWNRDNQQIARLNDGPGSTSALGHGDALAFAGDVLAVGGADGVLRLWDVTDGTLLRSLPLVTVGQVYAVAVHPSERLLVVGGGFHPALPGGPVDDADSTLYVLDLEAALNGSDDPLLLALDAHSDAITGLGFTPDGSRLVSVGADNRFILWQVGG